MEHKRLGHCERFPHWKPWREAILAFGEAIEKESIHPERG